MYTIEDERRQQAEWGAWIARWEQDFIEAVRAQAERYRTDLEALAADDASPPTTTAENTHR